MQTCEVTLWTKASTQTIAKYDQVMLANGFKINKCDKCVYIKNVINHEVIVCLYVDYMLIMSKEIDDINATSACCPTSSI